MLQLLANTLIKGYLPLVTRPIVPFSNQLRLKLLLYVVPGNSAVIYMLFTFLVTYFLLILYLYIFREIPCTRNTRHRPNVVYNENMLKSIFCRSKKSTAVIHSHRGSPPTLDINQSDHEDDGFVLVGQTRSERTTVKAEDISIDAPPDYHTVVYIVNYSKYKRKEQLINLYPKISKLFVSLVFNMLI